MSQQQTLISILSTDSEVNLAGGELGLNQSPSCSNPSPPLPFSDEVKPTSVMISNLAKPRVKPVSAPCLSSSEPSRLPHILKWSRSESGLSLPPPSARCSLCCSVANEAIYEGVAEQHGRTPAISEEAPPAPPSQRSRRFLLLSNADRN